MSARRGSAPKKALRRVPRATSKSVTRRKSPPTPRLVALALDDAWRARLAPVANRLGMELTEIDPKISELTFGRDDTIQSIQSARIIAIGHDAHPRDWELIRASALPSGRRANSPRFAVLALADRTSNPQQIQELLLKGADDVLLGDDEQQLASRLIVALNSSNHDHEQNGECDPVLPNSSLRGARADQDTLRHALASSHLEQTSETVVLLESDGKIRLWGPSAMANLGLEAVDRAGIHFVEDIHAEDAPRVTAAFVAQRMRKGAWDPLEFRYRHRDGSFRILEAVGSNLRLACGAWGTVLTLRDLTEVRELEDQLRHAQRVESMGRLTGGIAHDFNNLLVGIMGNISLALEDAPLKLQPMLFNSLRASHRAADLVRKLLTYGRKGSPLRTALRLPPILNTVVGIIRETFDRRISIRVKTGAELRAVIADSGQLHQVLLNLCINARDAMSEALSQGTIKEGRLVIAAENKRITARNCQKNSEARRGDFVQIEVSDTGIGMTDEVRAQIFEPFFTTKDADKGTGLGLATVLGIVRQHDGWFEVDSTPGKGSTFRFYLPAAPENVELEDAAEEFTLPPGGDETILIVDGEEVVREIDKRVLLRRGYQVLTTKDGDEALALLRQKVEDVRLVFLDLTLPGPSCTQFATQLQKEFPEIRLIVATSGDDLAKDEVVTSAPSQAQIVKPYRPLDLLRTVRETLDADRS